MDTDSNVKVTWSSHIFDVIKIRKRINILPLKVRMHPQLASFRGFAVCSAGHSTTRLSPSVSTQTA